MSLEIDFETRSDVSIKTAGVYNYFASPHAKPLMASYKIDGGRTLRWLPSQPCPPDISSHVQAGGTITAHNAQFERLLWQRILTPQYGWPVARTEQFRCTAATAAAMSLPRSLDKLGDAMALDMRKDKSGSALIQKFCVPRKPRKDEEPGVYFNEPHEFPEDFERFRAYCDQDVETEASADRRMVPLSDAEQALWVLDQKINDRGIRIDVASARAAIRLAEKSKAQLDEQMSIITGGAVKKCTEVGKLLAWLNTQGVQIESLGKAVIEEALDDEDPEHIDTSGMPAHARAALELRQEAAKTSVSKLKTMLNRAGADDRVRGGFIYHAAGTGRWQSTGVNFNNMPRPRKVFEDAKPDLGLLFNAFRTEDPDMLRLIYGPELGKPMHLLSDAIRGFIWAAPGCDLVQADYSGIEGAVAAWLADETWKIAALHEIIADPSLPDMYRRTAAGIMNMSTDEITKKHPLRQSVGKVSELALGFGGGVSAFHGMSALYGVDLDQIYAPVWAAASEAFQHKAVKRYEKCLKAFDAKTDVLSRNAWIGCELVKLGWREQNSKIAAGWGICETAIRDAIHTPGVAHRALKSDYLVSNGFLWCRLPSGRCLAYGSPKLRQQVWAARKDGDEWLEPEVMARDEAEKLALRGLVKIEGSTTPSATVVTVDAKTKAWKRHALYGGLAFQNQVQAIARDLLTNGMLRAEAAGYPIIAHVYDEMICEVPQGFNDLAEFEKLICVLPQWAGGMPLTAGGWRGKRYRKD